MKESAWLNSISESFSALLTSVAQWLPQALAALLILLLGWGLARWLRRLSNRLMDRVDSYWHRLGETDGLEALQQRRSPSYLISELIFWLVLLFFVMAAAQLLGWGMVSEWLSAGLGYLPVVLLSGVIILVGLLLGAVAHQLVFSAARDTGAAAGQAGLFGRVVQGTVISLAAVVAVAQLGVDVSLLSMVAGILLAALLGAMALAFGLGARLHVANVLAAQELRRRYQPGDVVSIMEHQGRIVEILPTLVVLDTEQGELSLPAQLFGQHGSLLVSGVGERDE